MERCRVASFNASTIRGIGNRLSGTYQMAMLAKHQLAGKMNACSPHRTIAVAPFPYPINGRPRPGKAGRYSNRVQLPTVFNLQIRTFTKRAGPSLEVGTRRRPPSPTTRERRSGFNPCAEVIRAISRLRARDGHD